MGETELRLRPLWIRLLAVEVLLMRAASIAAGHEGMCVAAGSGVLRPNESRRNVYEALGGVPTVVG